MTEDKVLRVTALRVLSDAFRKQYDLARADLDKDMERGDRLSCRSPLGVQRRLSYVNKTIPDPVATITNEKAFNAWALKTYPDRVKSEQEICGSLAEVHAVLFQHAPHLLRRVSVVDPKLKSEVLVQSKIAGEPVSPAGEFGVPGVTVRIPDAQVTCRPTDEALAEVIHLFRVDRLSVEQLSSPELPAGGDVA